MRDRLVHVVQWLAIVGLAPPPAVGAEATDGLVIHLPRPHQVVQRVGFLPATATDGPGAAGQADVAIEVSADGLDLGAAEAVARVVPMDGAAAEPPWRPLALHGRTAAGRRAGTLRVPAGGWYRLEIRLTPAGGGPPVEAVVEPVGVGEVFLVAGQSYATNTSDERLRVADPHRRVAARDVATGGWRVADDPQPVPDGSDGGSPWPAAGDALATSLGVPIGFVNVAWGGTSSAQWEPGSPLHERLVAAGRDLGRFRAVLWQQGESDVIAHTSTDDYVAALERIRAAAARGWGFEPPWLCAKSTHHPRVYDDPEGEGRIRAAVDRLSIRPGFGAGPDTDALRGDARGGPGSRNHWSPAGQRLAGALWADVLVQRLARVPRGVEAASFLLADLHLREPAWQGDVVWRESSVLESADGAGPARARLAHPAREILAITTADGRRTLAATTDWRHEPDSAEIVFPDPAPVPVILDAERFLPAGSDHAYAHRVGNPAEHLLYRPGRWFHDRNVDITYRRARGPADASPPEVLRGTLPRTRGRLAAGERLTIGISGDSISTGLDASETTGTPPFQPGWPDLVVAQLRVAGRGEVTHVNRSIAGWSVANGLADLEPLLESRPDLVIVAYGMNDVGRRDPRWYRDQTAAIVGRVRERRPEAEVLLVAPMLGNDDWIHTPREMFDLYRDELASLVGEGVALLDMTAVWADQLRTKDLFDLTGNGLNHPNDYGHRLYAQGVLALLLDPTAP